MTAESDLMAIERVRVAHVLCLNTNDAGAWAKLFTSDGVQMPPNAPANIGFQAIHAWCQGLLAMFNAEFSLDVHEIEVSGSYAFESGAYHIRLSPKIGEGAIEDIGKYITIYQRQEDESWKIARDIWNSDHPANR